MNFNSENFKIRYKQTVKSALSNKKFAKSIREIRKALDIPTKGFNSKKYQEHFNKWIQLHARDNFKKLQKVIVNYKSIINSNPYWLLDWMKFNVERYQGYELIEHGESHVIFCPSIEIFENYVNEKPFPGIFDFILFGKLFLPQTNFICITQGVSLSDQDMSESYLNIALSPNTTKRDFERLWPAINNMQKELADYKKGKTRVKKNFEDNLYRIYHYDNKTRRMVKDEKLEDDNKKRMVSKRLYNSIDDIFYKGSGKFTGREDELHRNNRRKRKQRTRTLIELS